ncbi:MAG: hypothetical protein E7254_07555 [Lachnospiraceae bacterium]|nr:hypothetical protein [Lachnospiraceae bacterium]
MASYVLGDVIVEYLETLPTVSSAQKREKKKINDLLEGLIEQGMSENSLVTDKYFPEDIRESAIDNICSLQRRSNTEADMYNAFFLYLNNQTNLTKKWSTKRICLLPKQYSPLERQLLLTKKMHDCGHGSDKTFDIVDVAREFMVSERTIETDLASLQDGTAILGNSFKVQFDRSKSKVDFISSVHPMMLTPNFTEVICVLEGLRNQEEQNTLFCDYAWNMAQNIWIQLSQYAKDRIRNVLVQKLKLDSDWYECLDRKASLANNMFLDEYDVAMRSSSDKEIAIAAYAFKSGVNTLLVYSENGNEKEIDNCHIIDIDGQGISVIIPDNKRIQIRKEDIISIIPIL